MRFDQDNHKNRHWEKRQKYSATAVLKSLKFDFNLSFGFTARYHLEVYQVIVIYTHL